MVITLTNTAQQERERQGKKITESLAMNNSHRFRKKKIMNEILRFSTSQARSCESNYCCCNPIFILCVCVSVRLCCWFSTAISAGPAHCGGSTCLRMIRAPCIPLFLSREERSTEEGRGRRAAAGRTQRRTRSLTTTVGSGRQAANHAWDPLRITSLGLSLRARARVLIVLAFLS